MDSVYFRINHKNKFLNLNATQFAKIKSDLFYELSKKNESMIYEQILKIFKTLLNQPPKAKDKLYTIFGIIEEFKKIKNPTPQLAIYISQNLINKKIKSSLNFTSEEIDDISTLICLGYSKLSSIKKSKIKTYKALILELEKSKQVDIIQIYKKNNFSPQTNPLKLTISPELLLLKYIFKDITNINISLKDFNNSNIFGYLLVFLNQDWLFPLINEIKLDLTYEKLENEMEVLMFNFEKKYYLNCLNNIFYFNEEEDSDDNNINNRNIINNVFSFNLLKNHFKYYFNKKIDITSIEENNNLNNKINDKITKNKSLINDSRFDKIYSFIIKDNNKIYDIILSYFYFIKELKNLHTLKITMPSGFIKESRDFLKLKNLPNIDPLIIYNFEYLSTLSTLTSFNITFNSLELKTFSNVIYMIQNNIELKNLSLNFFPHDNNKKIFNSQNLLKLAQETGICSFIEKEKIIKQKLVEIFGINLEKLFILLQTRKNLEKLEIILNLPPILKDNKGYYLTLIKFILNIFILLNQDKHNLTELKMDLPFFNIDNIKYPIMREIFNKININDKNKLLTKLYLNASFNKIKNIKNIISYNLLELNIGELDLSTFKCFTEFFNSNEFKEKSHIKILIIRLSKSVVRFKDCKSYLDILLSAQGQKSLDDISIKCYFKIKCKKLNDLLIKSNGNNIQKYSFTINVKELKKYKKLIEYNSFYYLNETMNKTINKYIPIYHKFNLIDKAKISVVKKINTYLMPANRKIINIERTFLE